MPEQRGVRAVEDVDAAVDELYANAPDAFTKKRDELAKRLKSEGRGDAAATVKALRKPTQIAWVLNQVARRFADEVGELVDVGRELARAQRKALRGGDASGELRTAIGRQRDVVRDLTTKAGGLMRELGVAATGHLDEIAGALQAALVDPIVGAQLEEGRLEKVPERATGFPGASAAAAAATEVAPREIPAPPKSAPRSKREKTAKEKQAEARAAKREAAERARDEKRRALEAKERAKREAKRQKLDAKAAALAEKRAVALEQTRTAWQEAKARAEQLVREATEARQTADALRADAKRLMKEAKETERAAKQAETTAEKSEKAAATAEHEAKRLATKAHAK